MAQQGRCRSDGGRGCGLYFTWKGEVPLYRAWCPVCRRALYQTSRHCLDPHREVAADDVRVPESQGNGRRFWFKHGRQWKYHD